MEDQPREPDDVRAALHRLVDALSPEAATALWRFLTVWLAGRDE
jgi:hypothetical protein